MYWPQPLRASGALEASHPQIRTPFLVYCLGREAYQKLVDKSLELFKADHLLLEQLADELDIPKRTLPQLLQLMISVLRIQLLQIFPLGLLAHQFEFRLAMFMIGQQLLNCYSTI